MASHPDFITVSHGLRGYFPVRMTWNEDGFYEPYDSYPYSSGHPDKSAAVAVRWAESEGLKYVQHSFVDADE